MFSHGLVFGKFMPVHAGHLALIDFALKQCERLTVSMSVTPDDPISPALRERWLRALLADRPGVEVVVVDDDFHDPALPLYEATKSWARFIRQRFPDVDAFFCSEAYGAPLSEHLQRPCILFDPQRVGVPVSATQIRTHPYRYWEFIPVVVRPYFTKRVCLYGPESVGKTTTGRQLADHYQTAFVHEVARDLITDNAFSLDDIVKIGHAQSQAVLQAMERANKVLICDTDVITTGLYSEIYLNEVPPVLAELEAQVPYDLYFLLDIDVPWVADGLRDLGHRRQEMFDRFKAALDRRNIAYVRVSGDWATRWQTLTDAIDALLEAGF
ncbi:AAA family ATPase [Rudanella paleaurantiibacter]|uniref:AAA family ATPase n=1 Tax=Rudanella paleaurantiibacter TaxID=2614655 RepID=A0A7J5TXT8_9BACT|nr:AAA family ATPase [Rudanella paleaurantiibacter]KAB7729959.1 AAA family ATPase [Rudanella paleaurantiibacter]